MEKTNLIQCWGIPYGNKYPDRTESTLIELKCKSKKEFKQIMKEGQHKLTSKPWICIPENY